MSRRPVLITVDVEIARDRPMAAQREALRTMARDLADLPTTCFCTADAAEAFAPELRALQDLGHEIGCHGLDHSPADDYRRMEVEEALGRLSASAARIERAVGRRPRVFRGPRMTTSAATQAALETLGFEADFSPCSRRFDPGFSSGFERRWRRLGPRPYAPSTEDPFRPPRAGERARALIAVPLSGLGAPFVSGVLYLLGLRATRLLARALSAASPPGAPLVYLFHSYEFADLAGEVDHRPWHHVLYLRGGERRRAANLALLHALTGARGGAPATASAYLQTLERERHVHDDAC